MQCTTNYSTEQGCKIPTIRTRISRVPAGSAQMAQIRTNRAPAPSPKPTLHARFSRPPHRRRHRWRRVRIGYLDGAAARAAEHDLVEAAGGPDILHERRRRLLLVRRLGRGCGHRNYTPTRLGRWNPSLRALTGAHTFWGLFGDEEAERRRGNKMVDEAEDDEAYL
jgi:hypothetical protein